MTASPLLGRRGLGRAFRPPPAARDALAREASAASHGPRRWWPRPRRSARRRRRRVPRVRAAPSPGGEERGPRSDVRPRDLVVLLRRVVVRARSSCGEGAPDGVGCGRSGCSVAPHAALVRYLVVLLATGSSNRGGDSAGCQNAPTPRPLDFPSGRVRASPRARSLVTFGWGEQRGNFSRIYSEFAWTAATARCYRAVGDVSPAGRDRSRSTSQPPTWACASSPGRGHARGCATCPYADWLRCSDS